MRKQNWNSDSCKFIAQNIKLITLNFLDSIKHKASAVYLLGDMFDFWYEFRLVVPKGYTRFLGKLSELTDMGVEVHFLPATMISGVGIIFLKNAE